ncbi:hypothetical protein CHS0354_038854 [Potamilus streckersoni]|uniref:Uncharacterized protein n=1 Tax=Potamilus streckersoni TaxID=2493646 RepID=A0AAE0WDH8_9BIVA|nr:hypothetical protein CHS0354_038854 [Potamilus streckersoni]
MFINVLCLPFLIIISYSQVIEKKRLAKLLHADPVLAAEMYQLQRSKTGQLALLQQRRGKVVVICSCDKSGVASPILKPCVLFMYKLDQGSLSRTAESSSRV